MTGGKFMSAPLNIFAIFDHAPGTVDIDTVTDPTAACNRPAIDPVSWLPNIHCHSELDVFELVSTTTVPVTHTALATASTSVFTMLGMSITRVGQARYTDIPLVAHGQGAVPNYMIAHDGARLVSGKLIQHDAFLGGRVIQHWADATYIYLREEAHSGSATLVSQAESYQVMVFKTPVADPLLPLRSFDEATGELQLAQGKLRSNKHYLRNVLAGESSFDFNLDYTIDANNGGVRVVSGGVIYDDNGYGGSYAGPAYVPVGGLA